MAEFKKVAQEKMRICKQFGCDKCPLGKHNTTHFGTCSQWAMAHPEEAERIIMQWAAAHPIVTNGMKFREVFGINLDSIEVVCRDVEGKVSHHQDVSTWLSREYKGGHDGKG